MFSRFSLPSKLFSGAFLALLSSGTAHAHSGHWGWAFAQGEWHPGPLALALGGLAVLTAALMIWRLGSSKSNQR